MYVRMYVCVHWKRTKVPTLWGSLEAALGHLRLVVPYHLLKAHPDRPAGLPVQDFLRARRVRAPLLRVVRRHGVIIHNIDAPLEWDSILPLNLLDDLAHELRKVPDGELVAVPDVHGARLVRVHERDQAIDEVVDVLEGPSLLAVSVDRHVFALECLHDEVGHDAAIGRVHCCVFAKMKYN